MNGQRDFLLRAAMVRRKTQEPRYSRTAYQGSRVVETFREKRGGCQEAMQHPPDKPYYSRSSRRMVKKMGTVFEKNMNPRPEIMRGQAARREKMDARNNNMGIV